MHLIIAWVIAYLGASVVLNIEMWALCPKLHNYIIELVTGAVQTSWRYHNMLPLLICKKST